MMTAGELTELLDSRIEMFFDGEPKKPANDDGLLDRAGAAKFLRCSTAQIDKLCREHGLPYTRLGDVKRFVKTELLAFVKAQGK